MSFPRLSRLLWPRRFDEIICSPYHITRGKQVEATYLFQGLVNLVRVEAFLSEAKAGSRGRPDNVQCELAGDPMSAEKSKPVRQSLWRQQYPIRSYGKAYSKKGACRSERRGICEKAVPAVRPGRPNLAGKDPPPINPIQFASGCLLHISPTRTIISVMLKTMSLASGLLH
jgi:hypothetical protein